MSPSETQQKASGPGGDSIHHSSCLTKHKVILVSYTKELWVTVMFMLVVYFILCVTTWQISFSVWTFVGLAELETLDTHNKARHFVPNGGWKSQIIQSTSIPTFDSTLTTPFFLTESMKPELKRGWIKSPCRGTLWDKHRAIEWWFIVLPFTIGAECIPLNKQIHLFRSMSDKMCGFITPSVL